MGSLVAVTVLSFTVALAVALGIVAAYTLITMILFAFAGNREASPASAPAFVPSHTPVSGD